MQIVKIFFATIVVVFLLDVLWLGLIAKSFYHDSLSFLLRKSNGNLEPIWTSAIFVYIFLTLAVVLFALPKAEGKYLLGLCWGGILGMIIYGVYDFTNHALIANWPLSITLIDFIWGAVICALSTCFAVFVQNSIT